jgi:uncharacterized membrane protein YkgB
MKKNPENKFKKKKENIYINNELMHIIIICKSILYVKKIVCPHDEKGGGILIYPCSSIHPSVRPS